MMNYTLNNLGSKNFEHLVQALSKKIIGEGVSIYGAGPDGQREATFNGKAPYPSAEECWDGYWVIQAKFKEPDTKKVDFLWIRDNFVEEMEGFQKKQQEGKSIPDNYLFFTNIVLTPVEEKGIKDKINKIADSYKYLIPHIHILGADDIYRFLDGNRDVAVSYSSYILSGDILSYLYDKVNAREIERHNAFIRYVSQTFLDDSCSRMEQAGQVTEEKVSIDKVYVDLEFYNEKNQDRELFIEYSIRTGNELFRFSEIESRTLSDKTNANKSTSMSNKYVLKGSAGQGKSTVCQFLAQIYRASFLNKFDKTSNPKVQDFLDQVKSDNIALPTCYRVPVKIELRLYSSWIINRQKDNKQHDLITYISSIIANKSAEKFDNETLRLYLREYSWVFFFDGLDEVPESSNRKDIMNEIEHFIEVELRQADTDALFFATTRPEGYVGEFNSVKFMHVNLLHLSRDICFKYLDKLLLAIEDDTTKRNHYLEILNQSWNNDQIAFMMQTPLQATIIAILVRAGGEPPSDKYSLFKEYFDIIIKREKQKGMDSILNNNQDLIENVYYLLGYDLQKNSSTTEMSDALIPLERMKQLIKAQLQKDGIGSDTLGYEKTLTDTYSMIVNRINFASEIREGYIGFSIRSMQEFLAAVYIVRTVNDEKLGRLLKDLAKSSYWQNTFIFAVECIAKIKTYYIDILIDSTLSELNGNDESLTSMNPMSNIHYGSQVAFSLLSYNIFKNKPRYENKLCKYIIGYCKLQPSLEMNNVLSMSDNVKQELTNYLLGLTSYSDSDFVLIGVLMQDPKNNHLLEHLWTRYYYDIAENYFNLFNGKCPHALYDIIFLTIDSGALLNLDLIQLQDFISNIDRNVSETAYKTLLMLTIKAILKGGIYHLKDNSQFEIVNRFFGCNLELLYDLRNYAGEHQEITDYLNIVYRIPSVKKEELSDLISLAKTNGLNGLALILDTFSSTDINDYRFFFDNALNYKEEIITLGGESLIIHNNIMWQLCKILIGESNCTIDDILDDNLIAVLNSTIRINSLEEVLQEDDKNFSVYDIMISGSIGSFDKLYKDIALVYTEDEIKKRPNLIHTILWSYARDYLSTYQHKDHHLRDSNFNKLDSYLPNIIEYVKAVDEYLYWSNFIWQIAFLKMSPKDYLDNSNVVFFSRNNQNYWRFGSKFNKTDKKTIINSILNYISITENESALNLLLEFLLDCRDYESWCDLNWNLLDKYAHPQIMCLKEITNSTVEQNIIDKFLPLLGDKEVDEYIYRVLFNENMPKTILPLYVHYLKKYRKESNQDRVRILEARIRDYITTSHVDIET